MTDFISKTTTRRRRRRQAAERKQQAALQKEAAEERALPKCPFCGSEFYVTETQDQIDRHLSSCGAKKAAATSASVADRSTPMAPSLSSSLVIGLKGEDLGSLVGSVAEFGARGVRPTGTFCDRAMQALCNSK